MWLGYIKFSVLFSEDRPCVSYTQITSMITEKICIMIKRHFVEMASEMLPRQYVKIKYSSNRIDATRQSDPKLKKKTIVLIHYLATGRQCVNPVELHIV